MKRTLLALAVVVATSGAFAQTKATKSTTKTTTKSVTAATPATPAKPATSTSSATPATPATPAKPKSSATKHAHKGMKKTHKKVTVTKKAQ